MKLLNHIRSKSRETRSRYALGIASAVTGMISIVWISTLPSRFSEVSVAPAASPERSGFAELKQVFDETTAQLGNAVNWEGDVTAETDDSNLGDLSAGNSTSTSNLASDSFSGLEKPAEEDTGEASTTPVMESPRMILIGTTTQKSEQ